MVVRADRDAARDAHHVRLPERSGQRRLGGLAVIAHDATANDRRARPNRLRGEGEGVRVADLAGTERLPRFAKLVARNEHRHPRHRAATYAREAERREHGHLRGSQLGAGRYHDGSRANVLA